LAYAISKADTNLTKGKWKFDMADKKLDQVLISIKEKKYSLSDFWKYADVMCGTSIGAILASSYAYGKTPDEMESFFTTYAKRIFTIRTAADVASGSHNASVDSNRPNLAQKAFMFATDDAFYKSAFEDSNYGHNILQQILVNNFGTDTLANLKLPDDESVNKYILVVPAPVNLALPIASPIIPLLR
jgi:hypothetical protein